MIKTRRRSAEQIRVAKIKTQNEKKRARAAERAGVEPLAYRLEATRHLIGGLSIPTMHDLIKRGLLRPIRTTRHLLFSREEIQRFLREGMTNE